MIRNILKSLRVRLSGGRPQAVEFAFKPFWQRFDGRYEKEVVDILLHNGDVVRACWPSAGSFFILTKDGNKTTYQGGDIAFEDVAFVKLSKYATFQD